MSHIINYDLANRLYQMNNPYIATDLFYANTSIERFMALKKETYVSESTVSQNSDGVPGASKMDQMIGEQGKAIIKVAENLAAKKIIQTYYDQYMSPMSSDIHYRLGTVSGVKANSISEVAKVSSKINTAEYNKDNLILDANGRIFTRSNLSLQFPVSLFSGSRQTDIKYDVPYINQFFPPFQRTGNIRNSDKNFYRNLNAWRSDSNNKSGVATMDLNTYKCSRGNFTYREPAFKSINDNIQFLQYLLEQCTGIVSTYLTEWDLSIYMQEGILPTVDENPTGNPVIYLLQGVRYDNPIADKASHFYYGADDDRPLGFAAVNAAVSKLNSDCLRTWVPNYFPLSCFWTPYWSYDDFVQKKAHRDNQICYISDGETSVIAPDFYSTAVQNQWTNIDGYGSTFKQRVILADKRNAALSSWTSWDGLCYYNLFYSTPEDGLSTTDTLIQSLDKKSNKVKDAMKLLRENIISMGGSYGAPLSAGNTGSSQQIPATSTDGSSMSSAQIANTSSGGGGGGGNVKSDFLKWMIGKKSKPSDPDASSLAAGAGGGSSDDSGLSPHNSNGCSSAGAAIDKFVASGKAKKIATNANTVGIPQHNPPLFGGPHGKDSSPRTPQSYFEANNSFLRNVGRIDGNTHGGFTDMNTDHYFSGSEQWSRPVHEHIAGFPQALSSAYNNFYSSPSLTMHQMQEGAWQWVWDYTTYTYNVEQYFQGEIRTTYSACSTYIYWPTTYDGATVHYASDSVQWMTARHYQPYSTSTSWYEGAYWSYLNENSYSRVVYIGNRPYWYVESYGPHRYGYITKTVINWYKKFLMHNEPRVRWTITRLPMNNWGVYHNCLGDDGHFMARLGIWLGKYYSRSLAYYPTYRYHDHGARYKLDIWDGYRHWGDTFLAGYWWRSSEAERAENKLIKNNRFWGSRIKLFFCEGTNQSYNERFTQGPRSIFRCDVRMGWYWGLYWYPHYRCICGCRFCHWIPMWRPVSFVEVLPESVSDIYEQTNIDPHTTLYDEPFYFYDQQSNWYDIYGKGPLEHMEYYGGGSSVTSWWGHYIWSSVGMRGWGILSNICGLNSTNISSPNFLKGSQRYEYLQNLSGPTNLNTLKSQRIKDITHYYPYISSYAAPYVRDAYGSLNYMPGGNPQYSLGVLDPGLSKAITRIWTRSAVCKDDGRMYYASIDNHFRLLVQQIKWQLSFLKTAQDMFVNQIDFDVVRNLLKNFVDPAVYEASSPYNNRDANGLYPFDKTFYDYWIAKARALFESGASTASLKAIIKRAFQSRITVLTNALGPLMVVAKKRADECSWNELVSAWNQIPIIKNQLNNVTMEDYIMSYLGILYQYRKYYINMRFNKQDGTMWMMRQLESILDNALSAAIKVDMPSINTLAPEVSMGKIPVAFYHITNTTAAKVAAIINKSPLAEDCIHTVYVKVEYVTKEDYEDEQKQLKIDGKNPAEGRIVYITENKKYARRPADGLYHLESQEYIDSQMNTQYNKHIAETSENPENEVYFSAKDVDYTSKYIYWGNQADLTPIKFGVVTGMDVSAIADNLKAGVKMTAMEQYCSCRDENDFWTVKLVKYPRASGYKTNVKLVKNLDKEGLLTSSDGPEQTINGALAYTLWPITEDQANIMPDDLSSALLPDEIKKQIANKKASDLS